VVNHLISLEGLRHQRPNDYIIGERKRISLWSFYTAELLLTEKHTPSSTQTADSETPIGVLYKNRKDEWPYPGYSQLWTILKTMVSP